MVDALKLFFSYSHKDEPLRDELSNHLKILEHQKLIASWHDRKILPGDEWDHQITVNQDTADIILLLISSDFIASRYCWDIEIKRAMELHESGKTCVIPVILRSADWTNAPFSKLQAVPKNAQPVTSFPDKDAAFQFVTQQIRQVATGLIESRKQQREQQQKDNAIATYRQRFQEFAADGEISFGEQFVLDELQQELGLTDAEVTAIQLAMLNPGANSQQLDRYRQAFVKAIAQFGYPLNATMRNELKRVQTHLKLSDADVVPVETPIVAQKEAEQQEQQRQAEELKQQQTLEQKKAEELQQKSIAQAAATDDLSSEKGIDYTRLRDLLKAQDWKAADRETYLRMLEAVGRKYGDWLRVKELENFPCQDLKTIDRLWVNYSKGHFGFSVQKKILQDCGSPKSSEKDWDRFCVKVGWRNPAVVIAYMSYDELKFDPQNSPIGELPIMGVNRPPRFSKPRRSWVSGET